MINKGVFTPGPNLPILPILPNLFVLHLGSYHRRGQICQPIPSKAPKTRFGAPRHPILEFWCHISRALKSWLIT